MISVLVVVHVAIVLAMLGAVRQSVLVCPTMILLFLVTITVPVPDGDVSEVDSYCRTRF